MKCKLVCLITFGLFFTQPSISQERHNPDAHIHGVASLSVVFDAGQLLIELATPAANFLGFEHTPKNAQQRQQIELLSKNLKTPATVIKLSPECDIQNINVEMPFSEHTHKHDHHKHNEHKQDHDEQHKNSHREYKHSHKEHKHKAGDHGIHQDIFLHYQWRCNNQQPPKITLTLFDNFNGFEKLDVQWIAVGIQGADKLTKSQPVLELAP